MTDLDLPALRKLAEAIPEQRAKAKASNDWVDIVPMLVTERQLSDAALALITSAEEVPRLTERLERAERLLRSAVKIADEARTEWDEAPSGMRAGKIIIALAGGVKGYRKDTDEIHAFLANANSPSPALLAASPAPPSGEPVATGVSDEEVNQACAAWAKALGYVEFQMFFSDTQDRWRTAMKGILLAARSGPVAAPPSPVGEIVAWHLAQAKRWATDSEWARDPSVRDRCKTHTDSAIAIEAGDFRPAKETKT